MGVVDTEAIILRTYKLAEADKIAICLTKDAGLVRGVARGARRLKSRFGAGLEPFTHVNLSFFEREGRDLVSIKQTEIIRSFFSLARESEAIATLEYLAQLASDFAPPHQPDERMFRMVRACIAAAAENPSSLPLLTLYFELWLLKLSGLLPDMRSCGVCRRELSAEKHASYISFEGVVHCAGCRHEATQPLARDCFAQLKTMHAKGPAEWVQSGRGLSADERQQISQLTRRLIAKALERQPRFQPAAGETLRDSPEQPSTF